ncbi:helix-turn-helix transcriptional regulator [Streptomyces filamentosus]|nr:helix-turn-helix transcriptional regulator [Streptomyces filamentosus]KAA6218405.1 helix-turn-helix transcriptional regulator [Streptomyces filamentosus]
MFLKCRSMGGAQMQTHRDEAVHSHGHRELCGDGARLYASALRTGRIARSEVRHAPCLIDLALLHPDPDDADWLRPAPPTAVLAQLLLPLEQEIQDRRRQAVELSAAFEPFMEITAQDPPTTHAITVLEGYSRIDASLSRATADCSQELLTLQPGGGRSPGILSQALTRVRPLLDRGVRVRTLYQHTARHSQGIQAYLEQAGPGGMEIRTLEQLIDRLIIIDRKVAYIPAGHDSQVALQLRHPGLVSYLTSVFEQFWHSALPLGEHLPTDRTPEGVTGVQRSIAQLLVEGHVDEAIARRLGMSVRTCRGHIARLATTLGSNSRTQLGFLIAQSGILEQDHGAPEGI